MGWIKSCPMSQFDHNILNSLILEKNCIPKFEESLILLFVIKLSYYYNFLHVSLFQTNQEGSVEFYPRPILIISNTDRSYRHLGPILRP